MNYQTGTKGSQLGCLGVIVLGIVLTTYFTTGSLSVFSVYESGSLAAKIAVSVFLAILAYLLFLLFVQWALRGFVSRTAHMPAEDVICPGCGNPLLKFLSAYGPPVLCAKCKSWWHATICFNRKAVQGMAKKSLCPDCRRAESTDRDLFEEPGFLD